MGNPTANNVWVEQLGSALLHGGNALSDVPDLLKRLLADDAWRCFQPRMGPLVTHERFEDFVVTPPVNGLGASVDLVRNICRDDVEAADLLDRALKNPAHVHRDVDNVHVRPDGNSRDRALRRLREHAPELHADVLAERISAHAAMVQAGFRPRTFTVRADDPGRIAATLRRQLDADTLAAVAALLSGKG